MKKIFWIPGVIILLAVSAAVVFVAVYKPPKYSDFGVFKRLREKTVALLEGHGAHKRTVSEDFEDFALHLSFPFGKMFGSSAVGVPLTSYESSRIAVATISQFEVPAGSGYFRDFTLNIRPRYELRAPVFHIDFMKPSPGTPGLCTIDFFTVDKQSICMDAFFGSGTEIVGKALALVEPYQRTVEQGRGKITRYLDPYKSSYRMELQEPVPENEDARRKYYQAAESAILMLLPVYLERLGKVSSDAAFADIHERGMKELVSRMYANDFAIAIGKKIFKDSFIHYWLDGFWNVSVELQE